MLDKLKVPEIDVDAFFDDLDIQIKKKGISDDDLLGIIKGTWSYISKLQTNCLKMQRESIEWLTADLEACQKERDKYKKMIDDHPEFKLMLRTIERNKNRN